MPDRPRPTAEPPSPETAAEALARARTHARRAVGEAIQAARALLDAAALGWSGRPSEAHASLRGIAEVLDQQARRFADGGGDLPAPVMDAVLEALDHEIARWERRAASDPDARAVLRTFLGLREILWEFGLRRGKSGESAGSPSPPEEPARRKATRRRKGPSSKKAGPDRRPRVQRVDVKG